MIELQSLLANVADVATVALLLILWRLDRRILTLEIHFGIKEQKPSKES